MAKITRLAIIRCATEMFLEQGYSATSPGMISKALDISTGNLTYYFPTKEHLLCELVEMLCKYQWSLIEQEAAEGHSSIMAICLPFVLPARRTALQRTFSCRPIPALFVWI